MEIFGKSGGELLPVLTNLGIETEEAKRQLGSLPDQLDKSAESVDALGDDLAAIGNKLTEVAYGFLSEVTPAVQRFTSELAGIDAASIGAGLADVLVGAFVDPMKAAELLDETLLLGAKKLGNELVYAATYWGEIMMAVADPLADAILGGLQVAAGGFGSDLLSTISEALSSLQTVAIPFGFGDEIGAALSSIDALATSSESLMIDGAAKIKESGDALAFAFSEAQKNSTAVKQDFFGAEESSAKIADDFASLQKSARDAIDELANPAGAMRSTQFEQSGTELLDAITAQDKVNQKPALVVSSGGGGGGGKTAAQLEAEFNKQLGLIAGASPTQAIGQSASAQRVRELQAQLDTMNALGKGDTEEAKAIAKSIQVHTDVATGAALTANDRELAYQMSVDAYFKDTSQSRLKLEEQFQQEILEKKRAGDFTAMSEEEQKKKAQEAGAGGGAKQQPQNMMSLVQQLIQLVQKIEPKIPQHNMS